MAAVFGAEEAGERGGAVGEVHGGFLGALGRERFGPELEVK